MFLLLLSHLCTTAVVNACMHACMHTHTYRSCFLSLLHSIPCLHGNTEWTARDKSQPSILSIQISINQSINQSKLRVPVQYDTAHAGTVLYCTVLCSNAQHNIPVQYITALHSQHYLSMNVQCIPVSYNILLCIPNIIIIYECASVPFRPCVYILVTTY
jgi:hypothetical protein